MIAGIGVDLVPVAQMRDSADDLVFLQYAFTQTERNYASSRGDESECLAGIFAAKEAITKALAPLSHGNELDTKDIEILHAEKGAPYIAKRDSLSAFMDAHDVREVHVSVSHDGDYAIAFAIAES